MKTTRYFDEQVLRKRPCLKLSSCADVLPDPSAESIKRTGASVSGDE